MEDYSVVQPRYRSGTGKILAVDLRKCILTRLGSVNVLLQGNVSDLFAEST